MSADLPFQPHSRDPQLALTGFADEIDPRPEVQVAVLEALGLDWIEVRSVGGTNVSALSDDQLRELRARLEDGGIRTSCVASPIGKSNLDSDAADEMTRLDRVLCAAELLGSPYVRIFSFFVDAVPDGNHRDRVIARLREYALMAAERGIILLHENEKGIFGSTPERILDLVQNIDLPNFRLAWDSANFVEVGVDPANAFPLLLPYIEYLHVKDAVRSTGQIVVAGQGDGELPLVLRGLAEHGFTGFASIEPHLADQHTFGGFTGARGFGRATRTFQSLATSHGFVLS